jgi:hypothetical protein
MKTINLKRYLLTASLVAASLLPASSAQAENYTTGNLGMCGSNRSDKCAFDVMIKDGSDWVASEAVVNDATWSKTTWKEQRWPTEHKCDDLDNFGFDFTIGSPDDNEIYKVRFTFSGVDLESLTYNGALAEFVSPGVVELTVFSGKKVESHDYNSHCWNNGTQGAQWVTNAKSALPIPLVWGPGAKEETGFPGDTRNPKKNVFSGIMFNMRADHFRPDGSVFDDGYITVRFTGKGLRQAGISQAEILSRGLDSWIEKDTMAQNYSPNFQVTGLPDGGVEITVTGISFSKPKLFINVNKSGKKQSFGKIAKSMKVKKSTSLPTVSKQGLKVTWMATSPQICKISGSKKKPKVTATQQGVCELVAKNSGSRKFKNMNQKVTLTVTQ